MRVTDPVTDRGPGPLVVAAVPGDGIGPSLVAAARAVLDAARPGIHWREYAAGEAERLRRGTALPEETLDGIRAAGLALQGPMTSPPAATGTLGAASAIRRELRLWANARLAEHFPGMKNHQPGTALAVVRDLTEDIGAGSIQGMATEDCGVAVKVTSAPASTRIARFAFQFARTRPNKRVTVASQAKVLTSTDGLFLRCALAEAGNHPDITVDEEALDALCDHLARHAARYSVLLAPRLYGGFLSGLASGIVGSVGVVAGMSRGDDIAVFEAAHGSAPHYAGQNKVNPCSMILAGALLLDTVGEPAAAGRIRASVAKVIADGAWTTYDLGGTHGTTEMTAAIIGGLES